MSSVEQDDTSRGSARRRRSSRARSGSASPTPTRRITRSASRRRDAEAANTHSSKKKRGSGDRSNNSPKRSGRARRDSGDDGDDAAAARRSLSRSIDAAMEVEGEQERARQEEIQQRHPTTSSRSSRLNSTTHPASLSSQQYESVAPSASSSAPSSPLLSALRHEADLGKKQLGFHNDQYIEDISVEFLYKPHTVTALCVIVGVLVYLAFQVELSATDWMSNMRLGVGAAAFFVLILGLLIFPSGPFIRPHPLVWRLAFGVGVVYEIGLIILLFQTKESARKGMQFFDSTLGQEVAERSYAADCSFTLSNVWANCDRFVLSHFIGWIVKALILRDPLLCWVVSVQWELIEIAFQYLLPNFAECWWDQWVLDVALANGIGIYVGCKLAKYLEMKQYNWGSYRSIPSIVGKVQRTILQFTPASWTKVEWKPISSINRLLGIQMLIIGMHMEELNAFFLKHLLWIPPECKLNVVRLMIWAFVGVPSFRQIYQYMSDPHCKRIGHQTFLSLVILITELLNIVKLSKGEFHEEMPKHIKIGVAIFFTIYGLGLAALAMQVRHGKTSASTSAITSKGQHNMDELHLQ